MNLEELETQTQQAFDLYQALLRRIQGLSPRSYQARRLDALIQKAGFRHARRFVQWHTARMEAPKEEACLETERPTNWTPMPSSAR